MEVTTAMVILVVITTTVMTATNRCLESMIDTDLKLKAFKIARENMETLLGETTITEMVEFGSPEEYPDIEWELTVESFSEPINNDMWMRAISSASYTAPSGDREYVELTHWLTDLTDAQAKQIKDQQNRERDFMDEILVNPYGDDPEGLMMFQESLASDRKYPQAAKIALDLIRNYPDSEQVKDAVTNARMYAKKSASFGDYGIAADIVIEIATLLDDPRIQKQCIDDAFKFSSDAAKNGNYREAASIVNKIAEELPDSPKAETAIKYAFAIAKAAASAGDFRAATEIVEEVKYTNPNVETPEIITKELDEWKEEAINQPEYEPEEHPDEEVDPKKPNNANKSPDQIALEKGEITFAVFIERLMAQFK